MQLWWQVPLVAQSLAAEDFCPPASSPRRALPCVVSLAEWLVALAKLQLLWGIKTWALHEVCRIWGALKQELLSWYMCVHFYNIPEHHRRPGSCALQKSTILIVNSDHSPVSDDGLWPKGAGQIIRLLITKPCVVATLQQVSYLS